MQTLESRRLQKEPFVFEWSVQAFLSVRIGMRYEGTAEKTFRVLFWIMRQNGQGRQGMAVLVHMSSYLSSKSRRCIQLLSLSHLIQAQRLLQHI
jgi:hypothetical protein